MTRSAPRPTIRAALLGLLGLPGLLGLAACDGQTGADAQGAPNTTATPCGVADSLVFGTSAASPTLDPATINQAFSTFLQPAYEPLIRRDPSGEYVPALATSWGYLGKGNKKFRLELREGVTFSDGASLDAAALKRHFEYIQGAASPNAALLAGMTFRVDGPLTLTISMTTPNPILDELLSQDWVIGMVISPKALADPAALGTSTAGAGRYVLDEAATVAGDTYVYTANPDYWDPEAVYFEELTIKVVANPNTTLNALKTGELDAAVGDFTTASAARAADLQVVAQPTVWQGLGLLDRDGTITEPLADQRVRQAINFAIDRDAITEALYAGDGIASSQIALPGSEDANTEFADAYDYDPERARELLAEAGYADGFTLPVLSTGFANIGTAGQAIAAQLEKVGITLELQEKDPNTYIQDLTGGKAAAAVLGLGSPPLHISASIELLPTGPFNPFRTEDEKIAELYAKAAAAGPEERVRQNQEIVARVMEVAWFAPVTYTPVYVYGARDLGGLIVNEKNRVLDPVSIFSTDC